MGAMPYRLRSFFTASFLDIYSINSNDPLLQFAAFLYELNLPILRVFFDSAKPLMRLKVKGTIVIINPNLKSCPLSIQSCTLYNLNIGL